MKTIRFAAAIAWVALMGFCVPCGLAQTNYPALLDSAATLLAEGDTSGAQGAYQAALSARPGEPLAAYGLALIHLQQGAYEAAEATLSIVQRSNELAPIAQALSGLAALGKQAWPEAQERLEPTLRPLAEERPNTTKGHTKKSEKQDALSQDYSGLAFAALAVALRQQGEYEQADRQLAHVEEFGPAAQHPLLYLVLGRWLLQQKQTALGCAYLQHAQALGYGYLAETLDALGCPRLPQTQALAERLAAGELPLPAPAAE